MVFRNKLDKKGIELHINTLVIVILSLFILILSFVLYRTVISKSMEMSDQLNLEIKKRIEKIVLESEQSLFYVPFNFVVLKGSGVANFGYALKNEKSDCTKFKISAEYLVAYDYQKNLISDGNLQIVIDPKYAASNGGYELEVKKNEIEIKNLAISFKGSKKGVYVFRVNATECSGQNYGLPKYVFIVVK
ncbi:MAG: hypothetical protein QXS41_00065 [Candidatus Woesearchaeota archaeon]